MRGQKTNLLILGFFLVMLIMPLISAGVGISWDKESALVPEKTKTCLTYKVYNPWPNDVYAQIKLSDTLTEIVKSSSSDVQFIPKDTSSSQAIPVTFCFRTPAVYEKDCLIGDFLICKKECKEDLKIFQGEVEVIELSEDQAKIGGAGGSKTTMSVSAPLRVRVQCLPHSRNYSVVYILVALIAGILLVMNILKSKKKNSATPDSKISTEPIKKKNSKKK